MTEARLFVLMFLMVAFVPSVALATPEYSGRSGQGCKVCHVEGAGGELTVSGLEFAASGYVWPPEGGYRVLGPIKKSVRFFIGLVHIIAAFIWFGTILYVHMLLKPAYAEKGLPKGEVRLGVVCMGLVGLTGLFLTISRIKSFDVLYSSPWGSVLSVKIIIYLIMISTAAVIVTFIGPKLKKGATPSAQVPEDGVFDPLTLSAFDGKEGRRAFIAYSGKVYDVTDLKLWSHGKHTRHLAGGDMTEALKQAPHGAGKLERANLVGTYDATKSPVRTIHQRIFYFVAYMNLALVYVVLITIAYWRWGL